MRNGDSLFLCYDVVSLRLTAKEKNYLLVTIIIIINFMITSTLGKLFLTSSRVLSVILRLGGKLMVFHLHLLLVIISARLPSGWG